MTQSLQQKMTTELNEIRNNIVGIDALISTPYHESIPVVYADWTASGRMYAPIEERLMKEVYPLVANTHTETNATGKAMTKAYHEALSRIKNHVNASSQDVIICEGSGMTGVVNKFQRILGLKIHESFKQQLQLDEVDIPVVFVTHMEHHSNHISWSECLAKVIIIPVGEDGLPDLIAFENLLKQHAHRKRKFAAITAASNVTGIQTPYHEIARIIHRHEGLCFVDFACSAPYVTIDMHPADVECKLDAIFFSPHKFLGGPGSSGVMVFNSELYRNAIPDNPGGGTVFFTSPYQSPFYIKNIEEREDGGTPGFLQVMRTAMAIQLKEQITVKQLLEREETQIDYVFSKLTNIEGLTMLEARHKKRLAVFSFYIENLYYPLAVRMLNDRFGIQIRGGCACAGTYGHYLFGIGEEASCSLVQQYEAGDIYAKPGWLRMSLHPTTTDQELEFICDAIQSLAANHKEWANDYTIDPKSGDVTHLFEISDNLPSFFRPFEN
jgi:selenocysteine lyase/cysteine desulfurase